MNAIEELARMKGTRDSLEIRGLAAKGGIEEMVDTVIQLDDNNESEVCEFKYGNSEIYEEYSEIFSYTEVDEIFSTEEHILDFKSQLKEISGKESWVEMDKYEKKDFFSTMLEILESHLDISESSMHLRTLLFGVTAFGKQGMPFELQVGLLNTSSSLLRKVNPLPTLCGLFRGIMETYLCNQANAIPVAVTENMSLILDVLSIFVEGNKNGPGFADEIQKSGLVVLLFSSIAEGNIDKRGSSIPLKKLIFLLWKSLQSAYTTPEFTKFVSNLNSRSANGYMKLGSLAEAEELQASFADSYLKGKEPPSVFEAKNTIQEMMKKELKKGDIYDYFKRSLKKERSPELSEEESNFEKLYVEILPYLPITLVILLRVLLAASPTMKNYKGSITFQSEMKDMKDMKSYVSALASKIDEERHKEILCKAITGFIVHLLFLAKSNCPFQFEYISRILVDSNAILLFLKLLNQNVKDYAAKQTLIPDLELIHPFKEGSGENVTKVLSYRNVFIVVNVIVSLYWISKDHTSRISSMISFKGPVIFKRIATVEIHVVRYYALKILKSQLRCMGYRWKMSNLKLVSSIFLYIPPKIFDDFLSESKRITFDKEEEKKNDNELLVHILAYHAYHYNFEYPKFFNITDDSHIRALLPNKDDDSNIEHENCGFNWQEELSKISLDEEFKKEWEQWVNDEVLMYFDD